MDQQGLNEGQCSAFETNADEFFKRISTGAVYGRDNRAVVEPPSMSFDSQAFADLDSMFDGPAPEEGPPEEPVIVETVVDALVVPAGPVPLVARFYAEF